MTVDRAAGLDRDPRAPRPRRVAEAAAAAAPAAALARPGRPADDRRGRPPGARRARRAATGRWRWPTAPTCSTACASALDRPGVDGVLGTPDVIEDLLLLGALEGKVVIGSMNRGGLAGAAFEIDDRFTAYDADDDRRRRASTAARCCCASTLDDPRPPRTLEACAHAVTALAAHGLMAMVEPFVSAARRRAGPQRPDPRRHDRARSRSPPALGRDLGLHLAQGARSWRTWSG